MFDNFLIVPGSLKNDLSEGRVVGFSLAVKHANYRGCFISLHNGYFLEVDGVSYGREVQTFEINGQLPRTFAQLAGAVWEHWDYPDPGILHVEATGGLEPGGHIIRLQQSVLAAYGYLSTDAEWIANPPELGSGAGSDKTPNIVTYREVLAPTERELV